MKINVWKREQESSRSQAHCTERINKCFLKFSLLLVFLPLSPWVFCGTPFTTSLHSGQSSTKDAEHTTSSHSPPSLPHKDLWSVQLHTELTTIITTQGSVISTATHRTHHHHYHTRICDQYSYTQNSPPSLPHKDLWSVQLHKELTTIITTQGSVISTATHRTRSGIASTAWRTKSEQNKINKFKKKLHRELTSATGHGPSFTAIHCKLQYGCYLCWSAAGSFLLVSVFLPSPLSISNAWPWKLPLKNMEHAISKQGQKWWHVAQWCRAPPTVAMRALRGYTVDWPHSLTALATCTESTSAPPTLNGTIELPPLDFEKHAFLEYRIYM